MKPPSPPHASPRPAWAAPRRPARQDPQPYPRWAGGQEPTCTRFGENPLGDAILQEGSVALVDGHLPVPQRPGLGITLDEEKVRGLAVPA